MVDLRMAGETLEQAYIKAGYSTNGTSWTPQNITAAALKVLEKPQVKAYKEDMENRLAEKTTWSREVALNKLMTIVETTENKAMFAGTAVSAIKEANKMCGFDKPIEETTDDNTTCFIPAKDIGKAFVDVNRDIDDERHNEYWFSGGRGSLKSSYVSEKFIEILMNHPDLCGVCVRRVGNTLRDSVYNQILWAISKLGLTSEFKCTTNPMEITRKSTGQKIYFRGLDDPIKLKSIKPPGDMYTGLLWYEEADQISGMAAMRNVNQSVIRGGDYSVKFVTFNTPISKLHWINQETLIPKENRLCHKSIYLDSPKEWLGKVFIEEAEHLKKVNPTAYEHEYGGEAVGTGSTVFENLNIREITNEEISHFDNIYMGLDWGWFPDPLHWAKMHYDSHRHILYIYDEYRTNKTKNSDVWNYLMREKGVTSDDLITCDSAEPKSVNDFRSYGASARGAVKGPNSIHEGIKWLQSLTEIVIDPLRAKETAKEFSLYEYEKTKDGEPISQYPDENNHSIDAVRYALERVWRRKGN